MPHKPGNRTPSPIRSLFFFPGFIFPHKVTNYLEETLSDELIKSYRDDLDFQNLIDLVQTEFQCCGISSESYRDWSKNEYFNCTEDPKANPSVERCGVPFRCRTQGNEGLNGDGLPNIMCGFGVQEMKPTDVISKVRPCSVSRFGEDI